MPSMFVGSAGQIHQDLLARQSRFGLSYFVTTDRDLGHLAPVIERAAPD